MAAVRKQDEQPLKIDHGFRDKLGLVLEGDGVSYCYQCGACVGDCPTARFSEDFNPRTIMLQVLYGQEEELIGPDSPIWLCSNCFTCFDRCPQDVKPIEVIIALKNLMGEQGLSPQRAEQAASGLLKTGRSALVTSATHRRRGELGLPELAEIDVAELRRLMGDEDSGGDDNKGGDYRDKERS